MSKVLLEIQGLRKQYGPLEVLKGVDCTMREGEVISIIGSSGSNMQIAMPKIRQPMGTLGDQGVPFNVDDEEELREIRRWCRLFYQTHDLVPLLIDIYSKFPCVGLHIIIKIQSGVYGDIFKQSLSYSRFGFKQIELVDRYVHHR